MSTRQQTGGQTHGLLKKFLVITAAAALLLASLTVIFPFRIQAEGGTWDLGTGWTDNHDGTYSYVGDGGKGFLRYVPTEAEEAWGSYAFSMDVTVEEKSAAIWDGFGPLVFYQDMNDTTALASYLITEQDRSYVWQRTTIVGGAHNDKQLATGETLLQTLNETYTMSAYVNKTNKIARVVFRKAGDTSASGMHLYQMDLSTLKYGSGDTDAFSPTSLLTTIGVGVGTTQKLKVSNIDIACMDSMINMIEGTAGYYYLGHNAYAYQPDTNNRFGKIGATDEQKACSYYESSMTVQVNSLPWAGAPTRGFGMSLSTDNNSYYAGLILTPTQQVRVNASVNAGTINIKNTDLRLEAKTYVMKMTVDTTTGAFQAFVDDTLLADGTLSFPRNVFFGIEPDYPGQMVISDIRTVFYNTVTASAGEGGSISDEGATKVELGADKTYTITPDADYAIEDVKVNGQSVGAGDAIQLTAVKADTTVEVSFRSTKTTQSTTTTTQSTTTTTQSTTTTTESTTTTTESSSSSSDSSDSSESTTTTTEEEPDTTASTTGTTLFAGDVTQETQEGNTTLTGEQGSQQEGNVKTGESTMLMLLLIVMAIGSAGALLVVSRKRRA